MGKPLLDVTDVLSDPDFQDDRLTYARISETVDSQGLGVYTPTVTPFSGVVQPNGDQMKRLEDGSYHDASITIWTRTRLISGEVGSTADIVNWKGADYTVMKIMDWDYGPGYQQAFCDLTGLVKPAGA